MHPDPDGSWPEGLVVDLSPKSGAFWSCIGFERAESEVVVAYKIESTMPPNLEPGNYADKSIIFFGDEFAELTLRAFVRPKAPRETSFAARTATSGVATLVPSSTASISPPGFPAMKISYGILCFLLAASPICLWVYIFNSHPNMKIGRIGPGWGIYFSIVLSVVFLVAGLRICFVLRDAVFTDVATRTLNRISIALGITLLAVLLTEYWPVNVMYTRILIGPGPSFDVRGGGNNLVEFICGVTTLGGNVLIAFLLFRMGTNE
jgi:hypothetical protein